MFFTKKERKGRDIMNKERIKDILTIGISVFMLVVVIGISYSAFTYSGLGKKENKITTGAYHYVIYRK